jgi:LuxR family quorum-sensing system transcriptional regulator SolR
MQLKQTHPVFRSHLEIETLISPLRRHNINYFTYRKFYMDNSRVFLGTRPDWLNIFLSNKMYLRGNTEAKPQLYKRQAVLWSTLPNQSIFQAARSIGIDHGIYLMYPGIDYCEIFAFATSPNHPGTVNFYLNNLDVLENFTLYFRDQASCLLEESEKHKIFMPYHDKGLEVYEKEEMFAFCNPNAPYTLLPKRELKISQRQKECMYWLLKGATSKEIAAQLGLSFRTVEDYIGFLKQKFQARNKADLLIKLYSYREAAV